MTRRPSQTRCCTLRAGGGCDSSSEAINLPRPGDAEVLPSVLVLYLTYRLWVLLQLGSAQSPPSGYHLSPLRRTVRYSNHAQPDLSQVTKLRRCGVGVVNSGHVLQAHGSDALLRVYTDVGYAWTSAQAFLGCSNAREQTHRLTPVGRSPCKGDIPVLCKIHTP